MIDIGEEDYSCEAYPVVAMETLQRCFNLFVDVVITPFGIVKAGSVDEINGTARYKVIAGQIYGDR